MTPLTPNTPRDVCSCVPPTSPNDLVDVANRMCGALENGEEVADADFHALRRWVEDSQWLRTNGGNVGPHHYFACPMWRGGYPESQSVAVQEVTPESPATPQVAP